MASIRAAMKSSKAGSAEKSFERAWFSYVIIIRTHPTDFL
jgi:hypothetical protein